MRRKPCFEQTVVCASLLSLLCGCGQGAKPGEPKPQAAPVNVPLIHPHRGEITRSITIPGEVHAYQQAVLYAKVAGYLKSITVDKGDEVKEGTLLADIEVPELQADLPKYKADIEVAEADYKRVNEARTKAPDLVTPQSVDNARARVDAARAGLDRINSLLQFARITAPFSGVVTRRWVDPGAFIPAATSGSTAQGAALLTLMDFSKVRVQIAVPEIESAFVAAGLPVRITVEELPGRVFEGSVTRYSHALDEMTKTMLTEIELANPKHDLKPGMYAMVRLVVERKTDVLLIPVDALVVEKVRNSVFTISGSQAKKIAVKTGFNDGAAVEILDGLKLEDSVILVGKQTIVDGQAVTTTEAR